MVLDIELWCYAMGGTELGYSAMRRAVLSRRVVRAGTGHPRLPPRPPHLPQGERGCCRAGVVSGREVGETLVGERWERGGGGMGESGRE
eukprot:3536976-Rhodomonas_salina.1